MGSSAPRGDRPSGVERLAFGCGQASPRPWFTWVKLDRLAGDGPATGTALTGEVKRAKTVKL
ncbi:MAG TPA: hypothetical protein VNT27_04840 [Propionibacteriaceae bacterium]|nr:hypothetical protein [Propionibacteriaceae bacterium]